MESLYGPLNGSKREIRLLELQPATALSDPINCTLRTVSLSTQPSYIALSYVWGDASVKTPITVNSVSLGATANLCAALRRARFDAEPISLWVDAVCINQADNAEKAAQIRLMRAIYTSASMVVVWLGERDAASDEAMPLIFGAARMWERHKLEASGGDTCGGPGAAELMMYALAQGGALPALGLFLKREWWSRVWVIQEVAVSQRAILLCGDKPITFRDFIDAFLLWAVMLKAESQSGERSRIMGLLKYIMEGTSARALLWQHARLNARDDATEWQQRMDAVYGLQEMLEESWNYDSTDPRDKIYAWIGLVRENGVTVEPDYDATTAQVYVRLVESVMRQSGSLSLISFTGSALRLASPPIEDLPSWAPDLRKGAIGTGEGTPNWLRPKSFKASADISAVGTISGDLRTLSTSAVRVGKIELIDYDRNENNTPGIGDKFSRWMYLVLAQRHRLSRGTGPPHDAFFRILVSFWHDLHLGLPLVDHQNQLLDMRHMQLGYMAFAGYQDRKQDYIVAKHAAAAADTATYLHRTMAVPTASGGTKRIAVLGPATAGLPEIIRPGSMNSKTPFGNEDKGKRVQENQAPKLGDFGNFTRFFELWNITVDLKSNTCAYLRLFREFLQSSGSSLSTELRDWPDGAESSLTSLLLSKMEDFAKRFVTASAGKAFYMTDSGYLGLALNATRAGDYIYIVQGCSLPIVVREHDGGDYYEVVCQAYTWGAMYGEFVETMHTREQAWEKLSFR